VILLKILFLCFHKQDIWHCVSNIESKYYTFFIQEKKRLLEEEKRRAGLKEREEAVKQIINSHNTNIKNTKEEILKAATSSLNSTQTYSVSSKPYNPDS